MAKFSDEQKNFMIRAFGTTSSPAKIRRLFLQEYNISGRAREQTVQIVWFYKIKSQNFEKNGTIFRKKKSECPTKKTPEKVEEIKKIVDRKSWSSARKSAPLSTFLQLHIWEILKKNHMRFHLDKAEDSITEAHK